MNLGTVAAVLASLLAIGAALPALLLALALLFRTTVARAHERLERSPRACVGLGALAALPTLLLGGGLTGAPAAPLQLAGWLLLLGLLTIASLGGAGLAQLLGARMGATGPRALLRGALALELAALVPLVGWFVLLPLALLATLGAALLALLRGGQVHPAPAVEGAHAAPAP